MAGNDRSFKDSHPKIDPPLEGDRIFKPNRAKFDLAVKHAGEEIRPGGASPGGSPGGGVPEAQEMPLADGDALVQEALALLQDGRQNEGMELLRRGAELQQQAILQRPHAARARRLFVRVRRRLPGDDDPQ